MIQYLLLVSACAPDPTEGSPPPPPPPTGCEATTWYTDVDGDGYGDDATAVEACEAPPSAVAAGGDCDEADGAVHPGAVELCNLLDDDCDDALAAIELDADGDGFSACAGDCDDTTERVAPGQEERCDELDNDCDGLFDLDDDSVDQYSCGWCPEVRVAESTATFQARTLNPCLLDPTVSLCSTNPLRPDTHTDGERLHRMIWRDDLTPLRDQLLLFLPPGPGEQTNRLITWGAYSGYRVLSLGWQNDPHVDWCDTNECFDDMRYELLYGENRSPELDVWPSDSIVGRMDTLFAYLVSSYPQEGWDQFWDSTRGTHWENVVVLGWSVGSGQAAYVSQMHPVHAEILVSGPLDLVDYQPADWMSEPRAIQSCMQWGLYHRLEPGAGFNPPGPDMFPVAMATLGIPGPAVDVDSAQPPYGGARLLNTEKMDFQQVDCNPHHAMAMDGCMHADLEDMYLSVFCSAGADTCD